MLKLAWHFLKAFFFDEKFALRCLVGLGGLLGGCIVTVLAFGVPTVLAWTPKELAQHGFVALAAGLASMLPAPAIRQPDPAPDAH